MRRTINHAPPERMQPMPADNTSPYVMRQVRVWEEQPLLPIHTQSAMEIASWHQSLGAHGIGMAQFASTGTITDDLLDDIAREIEATGPLLTESLAALRALDAYARAVTTGERS